jgi:hypothetical protein
VDRRSVSRVTEEFFEEFFSLPTADKRPKPSENSAPDAETPPVTYTPLAMGDRAEAEARFQPTGHPVIKSPIDVAVHTDSVAVHKPSTFDNVDGHINPKEHQVEAQVQQAQVEPGDSSAVKPSTNVAVHKPSTLSNVDGHIGVAVHKPSTFDNVAVHKKRVAVHKHKDRHKSGRYKLTIRLNLDIANKIKQFCLETELDIQDFIELAAVHYIENVAVHKIDVDGHKNKMWPSHDDMMINTIDDDIITESVDVAVHTRTKDVTIPWNTDDDIIVLYQSYTGNRWKPADDRVGKELHEIDRRIIEIGILQTLLNAKGKKIHSFAYFMPEIQVLLDVNLQKETLDAFLQRRRQQWQAVLEQKPSQTAGKRSKKGQLHT